ncbi:MAG: Gfo/Idh/MocA family oxidoreductase [Bacteroidales bacterium]|nr:Gfo/Idh/MocA family oxidoreductase [Bacteroidales bacterium]
MKTKVKWGIMSAASIATEAVVPAMVKGEYCEVYAIASRNLTKAQQVASQFNISKSYGSYEDLLLDVLVEAVYIPLPNNLHVPWAIKALEAGKHVLLEKPVGMSSQEGQMLLNESLKYPELKIMEAFMYRHHPQWIKAKELVDNGKIGELKTIQTSFSFYDDNPETIVNIKRFGGGSLMDIGCYPISLSRFLFNAEPVKAYAKIERHPIFGTDTLATGILEFEKGTSTFFSSTLMEDNQRVQIFGSKGKIEIEVPFNPIPDKPAIMWLFHGFEKEEILIESCDQYTIQGDLFSQAIINNTPVPTPLEDAVTNMKVIESLIGDQ